LVLPIQMAATRAKLRELRDEAYPLTETGLSMMSSQPTLESSTEKPSSDGGPDRGPKMRMCHLCGTPQLLKSYKQHFGRCAQAWELDESMKPASLRRPLPAGPRLPDGGQPTADTPRARLDEFNRQALAIWKSRSLETCPNCRRSFHAKALRAHVKGCHGDDFVGSSFVGLRKKRTKESKRSYPTVAQSLERSPRVAVSKAGKLKLDEDKVEQRRSVPRLSTTASSSSSARKEPRRMEDGRRMEGRMEDGRRMEDGLLLSSTESSPVELKRRYSPAKRHSGGRKPSFEDRLSALEDHHKTTSEALLRIEALLRRSHIVTPPDTPARGGPFFAAPTGNKQKKQRPLHSSPPHHLLIPEVDADDADDACSPTKQAVLAREHQRIFQGNLDLAWPEPEEPAEETTTSAAAETQQKPRRRRIAPPPPPPVHEVGWRSSTPSSPQRKRARSPRGFLWRPEPLPR